MATRNGNDFEDRIGWTLKEARFELDDVLTHFWDGDETDNGKGAWISGEPTLAELQECEEKLRRAARACVAFRRRIACEVLTPEERKEFEKELDKL